MGKKIRCVWMLIEFELKLFNFVISINGWQNYYLCALLLLAIHKHKIKKNGLFNFRLVRGRTGNFHKLYKFWKVKHSTDGQANLFASCTVSETSPPLHSGIPGLRFSETLPFSIIVAQMSHGSSINLQITT